MSEIFHGGWLVEAVGLPMELPSSSASSSLFLFGISIIGPVQPLTTSVAETNKFPLQGGFAFWAYIIPCLSIIGRWIYHDLSDPHWFAIDEDIYEGISQYIYPAKYGSFHSAVSSSSRKVRKYSIGFWNS